MDRKATRGGGGWRQQALYLGHGSKEDQLMAKRKSKNLSAPAKDPKYEGRNNTKKVTKKKG